MKVEELYSQDKDSQVLQDLYMLVFCSFIFMSKRAHSQYHDPPLKTNRDVSFIKLRICRKNS